MNSTDPHVLIPRKLAQELVDFLKKLPYEQVHSLIGRIMSAPAANVVTEAKEPAK